MFSLFLCLAFVLGWSAAAFAESNPLAVGVEQVTKAPFSALKGANEHLFTPVKEIDRAALDFTDKARAATVSVGLNLGQAVEW
ncbi:MAG: hypothetical protein ACREH5_02735 [Candidatus Omnitrophota bacterium]